MLNGNYLECSSHLGKTIMKKWCTLCLQRDTKRVTHQCTILILFYSHSTTDNLGI